MAQAFGTSLFHIKPASMLSSVSTSDRIAEIRMVFFNYSFTSRDLISYGL